MNKLIIIILLIILVIFVIYKWLNTKNENFIVNETVTLNENSTMSNASPGLTVSDEIQLVISIMTTIHQNFSETINCTEISTDQCLTNQDKTSILEAYQTSQAQPIEERFNVFTALIQNFQNAYGDLSNIYWDFKAIDLKINKTTDDYYFAIIKNITVNKIFEYLKKNINILPESLRIIYPNEVPKELLSCIIDKYFNIDIITGVITYLGLGTNRPCSYSLIDSESIPIANGSITLDSTINGQRIGITETIPFANTIRQNNFQQEQINKNIPQQEQINRNNSLLNSGTYNLIYLPSVLQEESLPILSTNLLNIPSTTLSPPVATSLLSNIGTNITSSPVLTNQAINTLRTRL